MAGTTRLELATSAVTGQRSNQLNYVPTVVRLGAGMESSVTRWYWFSVAEEGGFVTGLWPSASENSGSGPS
jgi:hypothetical protein